MTEAEIKNQIADILNSVHDLHKLAVITAFLKNYTEVQ